MNRDNLKIWMLAAGIRAAKTFAQTAVGVIGTSAAMNDVNWIFVLSASTLAAVTSILTSIATGLPEVPAESGQEKEVYR